MALKAFFHTALAISADLASIALGFDPDPHY